MELRKKQIHTPLGDVLAIADAGERQALLFMDFYDKDRTELQLATLFGNMKDDAQAIRERDISTGDSRLLTSLAKELNEYFCGKRKKFSLPLRLYGSEFQKRVWNALQSIPYGDTWSYKQEAEAVGKPKANRAVASANGRNRIVIIIPCHRVIGADGSLKGYGSGIERKKYLLDLERQNDGHSSVY